MTKKEVTRSNCWSSRNATKTSSTFSFFYANSHVEPSAKVEFSLIDVVLIRFLIKSKINNNLRTVSHCIYL